MDELGEAFGSLGKAGTGDDVDAVVEGVDAFLTDDAEPGELGPDAEDVFAVAAVGEAFVDGVAHFEKDVGVASEELFDADLGVHAGGVGEDVVAAGGAHEFVEVAAGADGDHAFEALGRAADEEGDFAALADALLDGGEARFEIGAEGFGGGGAAGELADVIDGGEDAREGFEVDFSDAEVESLQALAEADGVFDDEDEIGAGGGDGLEIGLEEGADAGFGESGGGVAAILADADDAGAEIEGEEDFSEAGRGGDDAVDLGLQGKGEQQEGEPGEHHFF